VTLRLHYAQLVLQAEQRTQHIGIEGGGVAFAALIDEWTRLPFGARGIDGGVNAAEACNSLVDQIAHLVVVAHVGANEGGFGAEAAEFGFQCLAFRFAASRCDDACAFLGKATAVARPMPVNAPVINTTGLLISLSS